MPNSDSHPRLLVIGASGMLGTAWVRLCKDRELYYHALDRNEFELTSPDAMARVLHTIQTYQLDAVINCAAWTDVDIAETSEADAERINSQAVGEIAKACANGCVTLVHYSTDYVFSGAFPGAGDSHTPYQTDDPIDPINTYGRTKAAGEKHLRNSDRLDYRLIRTSWLYAPWGENFVRKMFGLTAEKDSLQVVNDQRGRPTSAEHLARISLALLSEGQTGTYHVTDGGECTWYELSKFIAEKSGASCDIQPCTSDQFPRLAARPAYSVLDISKTEKLLGPMPHWQKNVAAVIEQLQDEST